MLLEYYITVDEFELMSRENVMQYLFIHLQRFFNQTIVKINIYGALQIKFLNLLIN